MPLRLGHDWPVTEDFASLLAADGQPNTGVPLGAALSAHARVTPDKAALTIGKTSLTFAELDERANRRARFLRDRFSVTSGSRVAISLPNRPEFFEAVFAVFKLAAVPCPVSFRMGPVEFAEVVTLIDPACLIGTSALPHTAVPLHDVDTILPAELSSKPLPAVASVPGKIMNSGGSTGRPKLIVDPEPSAWGPDKRGRRRDPRITFLNPAPLHHSAPFAYSTGAILEGSHVICLERFDPEDWLRAVQTHRPQFVYLVPTMMSRIARLPPEIGARYDLSSIRTLTHMAAPCPADVKRWWIDRIGPEKVLEIYGGTERIGAAVIDGVQWLEHPGSVGQAAAGYEVMILDPDGSELPAGEIGEIYFRDSAGPAAAYRYIGSETRVRGDLDSFGDMGWVDEEGWLYIADRRTDMVLIGGANVFPAEIEAAIETLPGVHCAAVIGLPDEDIGNRLHAIVEWNETLPEPLDGMAFLAPALAGLGSLKRPASVEFSRERLRDDTGKLRRFRLRDERLKLISKSDGK